MKTMLATSLVLAVAGHASAQLISFTYSDLLGSFNSGAGQYTATAGAATSGDVSRLGALSGTAEFNTGSFPHATADFDIALNVTNIGVSTADGNGQVTIVDANGDTLIADIDGQFRLIFGAIFFEGELSNAFFTDISNDGSFDGTSSGSFQMPVPSGPYNGSIVELFFNPGNFFASSFANQTTLVNGLLVPAPTTAALLAMGGFAAARRRRA